MVSRKISYHTENKKSERRRPIFLFYQQLWNCLRTGHAHLMQIWNVGATCFKWFQYILYWVLVKPGREKTTNIPTMSFDILSPVELEIDYHGWRNKPTKKQQKKNCLQVISYKWMSSETLITKNYAWYSFSGKFPCERISFCFTTSKMNDLIFSSSISIDELAIIDI